MGKKSKKAPPAKKYGELVVGDEVLLKKTFLCKVTSVEKLKTKKGGWKVKVLGTDKESGAEIKDVKPADRPVAGAGGGGKKKKKKASGESKSKSLADFDMSKGGAGASKTVPIRAGEVRKGGYVMLKGKPCKVVEVSISKTGKHGHAKANIVGLDVFTGKKYNEISPTSHNMTAPAMYRSEWQLTDIMQPSGSLTLMNENGTTKQDLDLPKDTHGEWTALSQKIITRFGSLEDDKAMFCVVLKAIDTEQVVDMIIKDLQG